MSGTNSMYISAISLEPYFVSNQNAEALANGKIYFYVDSNRTQAKAVFEQVQGSGNPPNYTYQPLPNPLTLSGVGTIQDSGGNNVALYYYPFDQYGNSQLYYIEVYDQYDNLQFTREAWPPNTVATGGGSAASAQVGLTNMLTNPQFTNVLFNPAIGFSYSYTGSGSANIAIAPNWNLNFTFTNSGTITVSQTPVAGNLAYPNNPPYVLTIQAGSNITSLSLVQQLSQNADWAAPQAIGSSNYLSGSILLGPNTAAQINYVPSAGNGSQTIVSANNTTGTYATFNGTKQLQIAANTQSAPNAYDNIVINLLNTSGTSIIGNVQVIPLNANISGVAFNQTPVNRQIDQMFNYYNPLLQYKPVPSWLTGWDFPLNPAQFNGASVSAQALGANTAYYAWDQTILFQTTTSGITVSRDTTGALKTLSASASNTQIALIQYLTGNKVIEMLSRRKCVNISANLVQATTYNVPCTISLWYLKGTSTLPSTIGSHNSIVATLDSNGYPATLTTPGGGTWVQVVRSGLGQSTVTSGATNAALFSLATANSNFPKIFNQYGFAGWDMQGNADIVNATAFAIVVGTGTLKQNDYVLWQSISLQDGDIPTLPAPLTTGETLRACEAYYEMSFPSGTVPAQNVGAGTGEFIASQILGASTANNILGTIAYNTQKIATPTTINLYNPAATNAQVRDETVSADCTASATTNSTAKSFVITCTNAIGSAIGDKLGVHWTADSRLGQ